MGGHSFMRRLRKFTRNLPPLKQITEINKFSEFFKNCEEPWHFAKAEETTKLLEYRRRFI